MYRAYTSLASKHLGVVSRRLADVATIFLPVSFLAGFWGQNFDVLTAASKRDGRRSWSSAWD
jgi:magnesium transporter